MRGKPFQKGNGDRRAGRKPGSLNQRTLKVRELCRQLIDDPEYQAKLRERLIEGKAGAMEPLIWQHAFGTPPLHVSDFDDLFDL
jgi:hypothetical protein